MKNVEPAGSTAVALLRDGGLVSMAELLVTCCAKAFAGLPARSVIPMASLGVISA